jgi:hypothetical protein
MSVQYRPIALTQSLRFQPLPRNGPVGISIRPHSAPIRTEAATSRSG